MKELLRKPTDAIRRKFARLLLTRHRDRCHHVFIGLEMGCRDESGYLDWACSKCGKVFREECGLDFRKHGDLCGPWLDYDTARRKTAPKEDKNG